MSFVLVLATNVQAAVQSIEATFQPDSSNPLKNEFINQTASQGFCNQIPQACEAWGLFSLLAPIAFTANAPILANHADPRKGGMAKVPSGWRELTVTHASGDSQQVQIRIGGIGHASSIPLPVSEITGGGNWDNLWEGGGWAYAPQPCEGVGWYSGNQIGYNSFWRVPPGAGTCSKRAKFDIPLSFRYPYFVYGYELRTPNPLKMMSGQYTGAINYTVGPGQDFDMGDVMIPDDPLLTLNFNLNVQHTLKVDIPPGGDKVQLVPAGGWQSWLQAGRKPVRLFRDQTFNISASSRFKMHLDCQFGPGRSCYLHDGNNVHVPIVVSVSLPAGLMDSSGRPVSRQELKTGEQAGVVFQPSQYVDRKPGTLHFELHKDAIDIVLLPQTGKHYRGTVVVIWDSQV